MLNVSLHQHSKSNTNSINCLFSRIELIPSIHDDGTHFLQVTNIKDGYFFMSITDDSVTRIKNFSTGDQIWECGYVTNQDDIVIKIVKEEYIEEYQVAKMEIFPKLDRKFNCYSSKAGIQIRWSKPISEERSFYNTSLFDKETNIIDIDSSVKQIIILPYFALHCLNFDFKQYGIQTNSIGRLPSYDSYKYKGHGFTSPIYELPVEVNWESLLVGIEINKCVFSEEYESISHSSMDPGPETHYVSTNWHLKALIKFATKADLDAFLDKYPKRECTFMDPHFIYPISKTNQCLVFTFRDKPKNKEMLEKELNIKFFEYWQ